MVAVFSALSSSRILVKEERGSSSERMKLVVAAGDMIKGIVWWISNTVYCNSGNIRWPSMSDRSPARFAYSSALASSLSRSS